MCSGGVLQFSCILESRQKNRESSGDDGPTYRKKNCHHGNLLPVSKLDLGFEQ